MDRAAVNMTRIPVMMIGFGMDMEERDHEHPRGQPEYGKYTNSDHAQHLRILSFCNLRRSSDYTTWVAGASFNAFGCCRSGNLENEPVLGWPSGNFLCCAKFVLKAVRTHENL